MAIGDLHYNPTGEAFSGKQPMKTVEKLSYLNSIEDCYRYSSNQRVIGTYYPVRPLPAMDLDKDAEWPIVMPAGTIVSIIPLKDAQGYTTDDAVTGIRIGGDIFVSMGVDGNALEKNINIVYPKETAGLITVANGSGSGESDPYTDASGEWGLLTASGEIATTGPTYTRAANVPIGIVNSRVYSDLRMRYLNYEVGQDPQGIALGGILTLPYVGIYGSGVIATVLTAIKGAVDSKHQYVHGEDASDSTVAGYFALDARLKPDANGKFTNHSGDANLEFGRVLGFRNRVPYDLDEVIDSFPGSGMQGMDTGGLSARYYDFAKKILALPAVKGATYAAVKDNIKKTLYEPLLTDTANVSIIMGQVDVAFGKVSY